MMQKIKKTNLDFKHAFSDRADGISVGEFSSLNLGLCYGDKINNVYLNWKIFEKKCGFCFNKVIWANQVHGNDVKIITKNDIKTNEKFINIGQYDGLVTNVFGVTLAVFTADCVPVLLIDKNNGVCGVAHCGWKPLTKDVLKNTVECMKHLGAESSQILAAIGPSIGKCCFETNKDVYDALVACLGNNADACSIYNIDKNKYNIDLKKAVKIRLCQLGVFASNIQILDDCTFCKNKDYFSYRHDNGKTGRLASVVQL